MMLCGIHISNFAKFSVKQLNISGISDSWRYFEF